MHKHYHIVIVQDSDQKIGGYWDGHGWNSRKSSGVIFPVAENAKKFAETLKAFRGFSVGVLESAGEKPAPKPRRNPAPKKAPAKKPAPAAKKPRAPRVKKK